MIINLWKGIVGAVVVTIAFAAGGVVVARAQSTASSQSSIEVPQIYVSHVLLNQASTTAGGTVTGSFLAVNGTAKNTPNILYSLSLVGNIESNGLIADSTYDSKNFGPLFFAPNEKKQVQFSYALPAGVNGSQLGIEIQAFQAGGLPLGWAIVPLTVTGGSVIPNITVTSANIVIGGASFDLLVGPTVQAAQQAALQLNVSTTATSPVTFTPKVSIYALDYSGQPLIVSNTPVITINPGKNSQPISINLTSLVTKPGVYVGQAVLATADGILASPIIFFRYIIGGAVYNIRSVTTSKTSVAAGAAVTVTVGYSGTPIPINPVTGTASSSVSVDTATIAATLYNEHGQQIGSASQNVDFTQGGSVALPIVSSTNAAALRVGVTVTKNGVVVATYSSDLSPDFIIKAQAAAVADQLTAAAERTQTILEGAGLFVLAILIIGLVWLARRHSHNENNMNQPPTQPPFSPTAMMLAILIGGSSLLWGASISHAMTVNTVAQNSWTNNGQSYASVFTLNTPNDNVPASLNFQLAFNLVAYTCNNANFKVLYYAQYGSQSAWGSFGSTTKSGSESRRFVANGIFLLGPGNNNNSTKTNSINPFVAEAGQNTMTLYFVIGNPNIDPQTLPAKYANGTFDTWIGSDQSSSYLVLTLSPITDTMPVGHLDNFSNTNSTSVAVNGWSCDIDSPTTSTLNDFYIDGQLAYRSYSAGASRPDLISGGNPCVGTTAHGFSFNIPYYWQDGNTHTVLAFARNIDSSGNTPYDYVTATGGSDPEPFPAYGGSKVPPVAGISGTFPPPPAPSVAGVCSNGPGLQIGWNSMTDTRITNSSGSASGDTLSQGSQGYQIQISNSPLFTSKSTDTIGSQNTTELTTSGTGFSPTLTIQSSTQYYVRVLYTATGVLSAVANATTPPCVSSSGGAPIVSFSGNPTSVPQGGSTVLTWSATNPSQTIAPTPWWSWFVHPVYADSTGITCTASNDGGFSDTTTGWNGSVPTSGSRPEGPINNNVNFSIDCANSHGHTVATVPIVVTTGSGGTAPVVGMSLIQGGNSCASNGGTCSACTATLNWNVANMGSDPQTDFCVPTGGDANWASQGQISNYNYSMSVAPSGGAAYTLTCYNSAAPSSGSGVVATVTLVPPSGGCSQNPNNPGNNGNPNGNSFPF